MPACFVAMDSQSVLFEAHCAPERRRVAKPDIQKPSPTHHIGYFAPAKSLFQPRSKSIQSVIAHDIETAPAVDGSGKAINVYAKTLEQQGRWRKRIIK